MKRCPTCGETKPLEEFAVAKRRKDGRASNCKVCKRAMDKAYHAKSYETKIKPRRQTDEYRVKALCWKYGLTIEQAEALFERSGGICEICIEAPANCVDHDHSCCPTERTCGKCVRGLLCKNCNWSIGHMKDSPKRLRAAAEYLECYT